MSMPGQFDPARQRRANDNFRLDQQFLEAPLVVRNGKIALALDPASALYPGQQGLQVLVDGETVNLEPGSPIRLAAKPTATVYGLPVGGETGQVLAKKDNANGSVEWVDQTGGSGGGYPLALGYLGW